MTEPNQHTSTDHAERTSTGDLADFFADRDNDSGSIDDTDAQIGRRITDARVALGDSVDAIAERIGVTTTSVEAWESGDLPLRAHQLNRVAGVLGISLSWLIMGRGPEPVGDATELGALRADLAAARSRLDDVLNELVVLDQRLARLDSV